ncbi:MAG: hypothetical protein HKP32_09050 [Woeseia sp.]|nr:hypothetical protein [Woeseia sp.]
MKTNAANNLKLPRAFTWLTVMLALAIAQTSLARTNEMPQAYTMMAIEDVAEGSLVTKGKFSEAIQKISEKELKFIAFEANNNLCVSYTSLGDFDNATIACEAAVATRATAKRNILRRLALSKRQFLHDKAVALSNRGVLRAVTGDLEGAREDFTNSVKLDKWLDDAKANLIYIDNKFALVNSSAAGNSD